MKLWFVDAFTTRPFHGNPAAVALVDSFPEKALCQKIAAEINLSETAFVKILGNDRFHIRWFTPRVEVKLCGHGTLSAAHILHQEGYFTGDSIEFDSLSGPLKVRHINSSFVLDFPLQKIENAVNLSDEFLQHFKNPLSLHKTGEDLLVEMSSEDSVRTFVPNFSLIAQLDYKGIMITAKATSPYDFISRYFAPLEGINEDPVTGSAHCSLAEYWKQKLGKTDFLAFQASERGGEIQIVIEENRVLLGGQAVTMMNGVFLRLHEAH